MPPRVSWIKERSLASCFSSCRSSVSIASAASSSFGMTLCRVSLGSLADDTEAPRV